MNVADERVSGVLLAVLRFFFTFIFSSRAASLKFVVNGMRCLIPGNYFFLRLSCCITRHVIYTCTDLLWRDRQARWACVHGWFCLWFDRRIFSNYRQGVRFVCTGRLCRMLQNSDHLFPCVFFFFFWVGACWWCAHVIDDVQWTERKGNGEKKYETWIRK